MGQLVMRPLQLFCCKKLVIPCLLGGSTGERPFTDILTSVRYWIIHSVTIPSVFFSGFTLILTGLAYDLVGTPRPSDYFTEFREQVPLINDRLSASKELADLTRGI